MFLARRLCLDLTYALAASLWPVLRPLLDCQIPIWLVGGILGRGGEGRVVVYWGIYLRESEIGEMRTDLLIIVDKLLSSVPHPGLLQANIF